MNQTLLSVSDLKARGWTDALIARFLVTPDETKPNPKFRSAGSPMRFYLAARVAAVEATPEFAEAMRRAEGRKVGAAKAVATKRAATAEQVQQLSIEVPVLDKEALIELATAHYWRRQGYRGGLELRPSELGDELERHCVNYLRHGRTGYHSHLNEIKGRVGTDDAYVEIKSAILDAIAEKYDWLAEECRRQRSGTIVREMV